MTGTLWLKLLRDLRWPLLIVGLLLMTFEIFWVLVTKRVTTELAPLLDAVTIPQSGFDFFEDYLFRGPGEAFQAMLGGDGISFQDPSQLITIGYIHPLLQTILCIWAVGRASGAIAGEIDRGTMELLLAQPMSRTRIILAHLAVDLTVIPVLCLCMLAGTYLGVWLAGPFEVNLDVLDDFPTNPFIQKPDEARVLLVATDHIAIGLWNTASLLFALSGITMWLSAIGRFRWRVTAWAVLLTLLQFVVNVLGELYKQIAFLRPFTVFYYHRPQKIMLQRDWNADFFGVDVNVIGVLIGVGMVGYLLAWFRFCRRDIPAPL